MGYRDARRPGRIPMDEATFNRWRADNPPTQRRVWSHDGHRFEVIGEAPVSPELEDQGVHMLLAVPLDGGPGGIE